jgi:acetyl esterase
LEPTRPALLTPAMADLVHKMYKVRRKAFHEMPPEEARRMFTGASEMLEIRRAELPRVENLAVPAADGTRLAARLYAPTTDSLLPVLLYLHGGGFVIGDLDSHDSLCRQLALRSGGAVLALDYRLAPEHRFPTAVDDAWAALAWLAQQAASLGLDPARIAVGGDSAGGTLAAVCALHARDSGLPLALQLLITPGTIAYMDSASHRTYATGYVLEAEAIRWFFDQYIPYEQRSDWRFAPLNADDAGGVAPACVILAECDPLVDEGIAYADKLRAAGVPVELELYRGLTHDFIKMGRVIKEAALAQGVAAQALRSAWAHQN